MAVRAGAALLLMALVAPVPEGAAAQGEGGKTGAGKVETALFAGGCFWCMEAPFDSLPGVVSVTPGYTGGTWADPSYEQVSSGATGHAESVRVVYDPARIGYADLLRVFWRNVDPTDGGGQFCDRGNQYRSEIFYRTEEQRRLAEASREELARNRPFRGEIVTKVVRAGEFWPAEEYHVHYYRKNPIRYAYYRASCGRNRRLRELWGKEAGGH